MDLYMIETGIIVAIFLTLYSYLLYPLILIPASYLRSYARKWQLHELVTRRGASTYSYTRIYTRGKKVTLIISMQNCENIVIEKIKNSLQLKAEHPDLEIIVASDRSTDATDQMVLRYAGDGIKLVATEQRRGKEAAQQQAIAHATGDIIVFTDATTILAKDSIAKFLKYFCDKTVGAVSSEDRYVNLQGIADEEGSYIRYEMWLRKMESSNAGLIGMSGSLFAVRKELCDHWDTGTCSDFNCALNAARMGYKSITASDILGYYPSLKNREMGFERRIRTIHRGMEGLWRNRKMLNIFRFGFFAFQLLSHKLMRWLTPIFGLALFILCLIGYQESGLAKLFLTLQITIIVLLSIGHPFDFFTRQKIFNILYFICLANIATLIAMGRFASGQKVTTWSPSDRIILDSCLIGENDRNNP